MVEGGKTEDRLSFVRGEAVVDADDRLSAFDASFAELVASARGTRPTVGEHVSLLDAGAHAPVIVAAVARARLHGRTMTLLHAWGATGRDYELDLSWTETPDAIRILVRSARESAGAGADAYFGAALRSNATEMIAIFDKDLRLRAYSALYARAAESLIGRPLSVGDSLREVMRPQALPRFEVLAQRAFRGESILEDFAVGAEPGSTFELSVNPVRDESGVVVGASLISRNVTRRRQDERATAAAAAYRRAILDAMPDAFAVFDRAGVIIDVRNPAGFPVPLSIAAMLGRNLREFSHLPLERLLPALEVGFATGEVQRIDYELVVDGATRSRTAHISRINDNEALWVVRDVTDDRRASERLAFTDRMASVGTLAAGVAHELNNPLQYVLSNVEVARERVAGRDAEAHAALSEALTGLERASQIVSSLRSFSRAGDGTPTSVSLASSLGAALKFASHALKGRAVVEADIGEDVRVVGRETALSQVFLNILLNAVDAVQSLARGTGVIRVRTRHADTKHVAVDIFNNGPPIPSGVRAHIFDPFFTTKPVGQGTGLGLAIALQIVRAADGDIAVESTDAGTTFTVTLPIAEVRPRSDAPAPPPSAPEPGEGRVLVIDDDSHVARSLVRQLAGFEVTVVVSGEEGLRALESGGFDVVLCDITMPGMSGAELYTTVASRWPGRERRFVMMTGGVLSDDQRTSLGSALDGMLRKPFSRAELRSAVERARTSAG